MAAGARPEEPDAGRSEGRAGRNVMQAKRFKQVRFRQLRAFVGLAAAGSFAAAAERLGLSVPSVWQQVRALEAAFGCELVRVEGKRIALSDRGRLLLAMAAPLVSGFDELVRTLSTPPERPRRLLAIAAPFHTLEHELAGPLDRFRRHHPDIEWRLVERGSDGCIELVARGEVDVAIAGRLDDEPPPALRAERLARRPFVLACRADHDLAATTRLTLKAIAKHPLVVPAAGSGGRARFEQVFGAAGLRAGLVVAVEADSTDVLLACVRRGFGVGVAPVSPAALERAEGAGRDGLVFRDVSRLFGHEHVDVLVRKSRHQPPHEQAFCAMLRAAAADGAAAAADG